METNRQLVVNSPILHGDTVTALVRVAVDSEPAPGEHWVPGENTPRTGHQSAFGRCEDTRASDQPTDPGAVKQLLSPASLSAGKK